MKGLTKALGYKKDYKIRLKAVQALARMKNKNTIDPILIALEDENDLIRKEVVETLAEFGDPKALDPLISLIKKENYLGSIAQAAVEALGKIKDPRAIETLTTALRYNIHPFLKPRHIGKEWDVRKAAAESLGQIGNPKAIQPLIKAFDFGDPTARKKVSEALVKIGPSAIEPLIANLNYCIEQAQSTKYRLYSERLQSVASTLRKICQRTNQIVNNAINEYIQLDYEHRFNQLMSAATGEDYNKAKAAVVELGELGDPRAINELCRMAEVYKHYRPSRFSPSEIYSRLVLWTLADIDDPAGIRFIEEHESGDPKALNYSQHIQRMKKSSEYIDVINDPEKYIDYGFKGPLSDGSVKIPQCISDALMKLNKNLGYSEANFIATQVTYELRKKWEWFGNEVFLFCPRCKKETMHDYKRKTANYVVECQLCNIFRRLEPRRGSIFSYT